MLRATMMLVVAVAILAAHGTLGTLTVGAAVAPAARAHDDDADAGFSIRYTQESTTDRDAAAFVLPGATLTIEASGPAGPYALAVKNGDASTDGPRRWTWHAPQTPGLYELEINGPASTDPIALHTFVMVPAARVIDGVLNGYPIGTYPAKPLGGNPLYARPAGFVEVTRDNRDTKLSPHFTLQQFVCKQAPADAFPKYVVLHERLPQKLELVLARVRALGFDVKTLNVMSGYRTPYYNRAIGDVEYSLHQWGAAADVFVDRTGSGRMADLNRDGRIDVADARFLYDDVGKAVKDPAYRRFEGGLGFYPPTPAHPPFVHVDVRGTTARWKG